MNDLEHEVSRRFTDTARRIDVDRPPLHRIVERVEQRRRRRAVARVAAGTALLALVVSGVALLSARDPGEVPAPVATPPPGSVLPTLPATIASAPPSTVAVPPVVTDGPAVADRWSLLPDRGLAERAEHLLVATDTGVLMWGGHPPDVPTPDGAFYDVATASWRPLPAAPLALDRGDAVGVWTGTEVVVVNGVSGNVKAAAFDPVSFTWRQLSNPPVDNAANASTQIAFVDGTVLLFVVIEDNGPAWNQTVRLDDVSGDWVTVPAAPVSPRSGVKLIAVGSEAVVVGFEDGVTCPTLVIAAYAPSTDSWRMIDNGPAGERVEAAAAAWTGSELFVGGGATCPDGVATGALLNDAFLLDPATGLWREAASAPIGFYSSYRYSGMWTGTSVALIGPDGSPLLYNPVSNTWHLGPPIDGLPFAPNQTPVVAIDGRIIVAGGLRSIGGEPSQDAFSEAYGYTIPEGF